MKESDIAKAYDAALIEDKVYSAWEQSGFFNPDKLPGKRSKTFSIAMPPPNATGILHIGHAMFLTIQDAVIRFQRLRGMKTLWIPGTDHAAIATQAKVEKIMKGEGKNKYDLGRDKFLERVYEFVQGSQDTIRKQIRSMGSSCDWSRERYTLDEGLSEAVREAFVRMYNDGLIYRGERIVNWCPSCESTLADDEVEYKEEKTRFYYFKYGPVVIGTARPETKFLDKTIVVHPKDQRYQKLIGQKFMVDWIEGQVEANVIADVIVDKDFGTGAMTITPAHSFEDFDLAKKHDLPIVKIIDEKGNFTPAAGTFAGKNARQSREEIVEKLKSKGLLDHVDENYVHNLSVCYRCGTPVEPLPKDQWWLDVNKKVKKLGNKSLKEKALAVVKKQDIEIIPERFQKTYFHWMNNLRDWCISRQIWFGHRVPAWFKKSGEIYVGIKAPVGEGWQQDSDTLDTWFSSGLWTFSTLGWPAKTKDLKAFHPTTLMETGYDILFFWVARMILMSTYHMGEVPFEKVYLHGLVRDEQGRKMSKSLGNAIDPLDMTKKYGTDAVRLSLIIGNTPGNDVNLGESKIAGFRNFTNKLWNISRYVMLSVKEVKRISKTPKAKTLFDTWILTRLAQTGQQVTKHLEQYEFSAAGETLRDFTWNDFADWYVEVAKVEKDKDEILLYVLENLLILWHPFMPFVTEEIWKHFSSGMLMVDNWPKLSVKKSLALKDTSYVQSFVSVVRNLKAENKVATKKDLEVYVQMRAKSKAGKILTENTSVIERLAGIKKIHFFEKSADKPKASVMAVAAGTEIYLPVAGLIDVESLRKEMAMKEKYIQTLKAKLGNKEFTARAPKQVVVAEQEKLALQEVEYQKLKTNLDNLTSSL